MQPENPEGFTLHLETDLDFIKKENGDYLNDDIVIQNQEVLVENATKVKNKLKRRNDSLDMSEDDEWLPEKSYSSKQNTKQAAKRRRKRGGSYSCSECHLEFNKFHDLKSHRSTHGTYKPKNEEVHRCSKCNALFKSLGDLVTHSTTAHITHAGNMRKGFYKCNKCDLGFELFKDLKNHRFVHEDQNSCSHCGHRFKTSQALQTHMRETHLLIEPNAPPYQYESSVNSETQFDISSVKIESVVSLDQGGSSTDTSFDMTCRSIKSESSEIVEQCEPLTDLESTVEVPHIKSEPIEYVDQCESPAKLKTAYDGTHMQSESCGSEEGGLNLFVYVCDRCECTFKSYSDLESHQKVKQCHKKCGKYARSGSNMVKCNHCNALILEDDLEEHVSQLHTGPVANKGPHQCVKCDASFENLGDLLVHATSAHVQKVQKMRKGTYKCCQCDLSFEKFRELKSHRSVHAPPEDYVQCNHCRTLVPKDDTAKHIAEFHKKRSKTKKGKSKGEYKCDKCHEAFEKFQDLKAHRSWHDVWG